MKIFPFFKHHPIQEAIATWESGRSKNCSAIFTEEPKTYSPIHTNANCGTTQNPITKYECIGKVVFSKIRFKHSPPVLVYHVLTELSEKISDLSLIPRISSFTVNILPAVHQFSCAVVPVTLYPMFIIQKQICIIISTHYQMFPRLFHTTNLNKPSH